MTEHSTADEQHPLSNEHHHPSAKDSRKSLQYEKEQNLDDDDDDMSFSFSPSSSDQDQSYDNRLNKENSKSHAEFECSKSSITTTTASANPIVQETSLMQESFYELNQNVLDNYDSILQSSYSFTASNKRDEARSVIRFAQKAQKEHVDSKHPDKQFGQLT